MAQSRPQAGARNWNVLGKDTEVKTEPGYVCLLLIRSISYLNGMKVSKSLKILSILSWHHMITILGTLTNPAVN